MVPSILRRFVFIAILASFGCSGSDLTLPTDGSDGGGIPSPPGPTPPTPTPPGPGTSVPGAARIEPVEGNSQVAVTGQDLPIRPAVRVTDTQGHPVTGYTVTFVVTAGGGTLLDPLQVTGSDGIARVGRWTLGSPGLNILEARAGSVSGSPVVFQATALSRALVDHFVFVQQPDGVRVDESQLIQVAMVDADGNVLPLSGIEIYLGLFRQGKDGVYSVRNDLLVGERFAETQDGIATFRLSVTENGTYQLRALSDELPEVGPHGPEPFLFSRSFNVY